MLGINPINLLKTTRRGARSFISPSSYIRVPALMSVENAEYSQSLSIAEGMTQV